MGSGNEFCEEKGAFGEVFGEALLTFWEGISENGKVCLDCTGVGGLHMRPSRKGPLEVSFAMSRGDLF